MANVTPAERQYDEQKSNIAAAKRAGLSTTTRESNRARVNNTDAEHSDSQGIEGSLARRAIPDASYNASTYDTYEHYVNDRLAEAENEKRSGTVSVEKQAPDAVEPPWFG